MLKGSQADLILYLQVIESKLRLFPHDPFWEKMRAAVRFDIKDQHTLALPLYQLCKDDEFARTRIHALCRLNITEVKTTERSSLQEETVALPKLTNIMTFHEEKVFKAITRLLEKKQRVTQNALVNATSLSKGTITETIRKLQAKGYLVKSELQYKYIQIHHYPTYLHGMAGLPTDTFEKEQLQTKHRVLIFSHTERKLYSVQRPPQLSVQEKVQTECTPPLTQKPS